MKFQMIEAKEAQNINGGLWPIVALVAYDLAARTYEEITGEDVPTSDDLLDLF